LGLGDLLLGHLAAPPDRGLEVAAALLAQALGLLARAGDNLLRLRQGIALPALVIGDHRLRLLAQPPRLFELAADLRRALVTALAERRLGLLPNQRQGEDEGDEPPELGVVQELGDHARPPSAASTAAATSPSGTSPPARRCVAARATSTAMART